MLRFALGFFAGSFANSVKNSVVDNFNNAKNTVGIISSNVYDSVSNLAVKKTDAHEVITKHKEVINPIKERNELRKQILATKNINENCEQILKFNIILGEIKAKIDGVSREIQEIKNSKFSLLHQSLLNNKLTEKNIFEKLSLTKNLSELILTAELESKNLSNQNLQTLAFLQEIININPSRSVLKIKM